MLVVTSMHLKKIERMGDGPKLLHRPQLQVFLKNSHLSSSWREWMLCSFRPTMRSALCDPL